MKTRFRVIFVLAMISLLIMGCKEDMVNKGELLYRSSQDIKGDWQYDSYPEGIKFILIREDNIDDFKGDLRGLRDIDVDGELGIYVTLGEMPSGGYDINIRQVRRVKDDLVVVVKAVGPGPEDFVTQALTHPYHIVKLSEDIVEGIEKVKFISQEGELLEEKIL